MEAEYQYKNTRAMEYRIKSAKIPEEWSIDTFPFKQKPEINRSQMMSLAKPTFINRFENITFMKKHTVQELLPADMSNETALKLVQFMWGLTFKLESSLLDRLKQRTDNCDTYQFSDRSEDENGNPF